MTGAKRPWFAEAAGADDARRSAPSALRNRAAIADVLARELPARGLVLEIASGSGEHADYFARRFPALNWQPSDPDPVARASIAAWRNAAGLANLHPPLDLDAAAGTWPLTRAEAVLCSNMTHISPWAATLGLLDGAARLLPPGGPLLLYGPFFEEGVEPSPGNCAFDADLRARDPRFGLRWAEAVDAAAAERGLVAAGRHAMPANNRVLVYRRR